MRQYSYSTILVAALVASAAEIQFTAYAQDSEKLEEVVVTAQKREQEILEVPISLSVLPGASVESGGAHNLEDLNGLVPNTVLHAFGIVYNGLNFSTRGIGFWDTDPAADMKTKVLIDGVAHSRNTGLLHDQIDVERIEVLRGPQGTIFGRSSLAGTINIVTRPVRAERDLSLRLDAGNYGARTYRVSGESGDMLDSTLRARFTHVNRSYGGHTYNAFNQTSIGTSDSDATRLKVDHTMGNMNNTLVVYRNDDDTHGLPLTNLTQDPRGIADGDIDRIYLDEDGGGRSTEEGITLLTDVELESGTLSVVTNSHTSYWWNGTDVDGRAGTTPPAPGPRPNLIVHLSLELDHKSDSIEFRFADETGGRIDFLAGTYFFLEESIRDLNQNIGPPFSPTPSLRDAYIATNTKQRTRSYAVFAQADYHVNEVVSLVAGGRYSEDQKNIHVTNFSVPPPAPQRPPQFLNISHSWDQFTWKVGANFRPHADLSYYATISTGFKPGGFTGRATVAENFGPYFPEYIRNYEVGLKTTRFDGRLRLSMAGFWMEHDDVVGIVRRPNSTGRSTEPVNLNLGDSQINGIEFEATALLFTQTTIDFAMSFLDAKWQNFMADLNSDGIVTDNKDLDLLLAPSWSGTIGLHHKRELTKGTLNFSLDGRFQAKHNTFGQSNDAIFYRPTSSIYNSSVRYTWNQRGDSISLYVRNLTDKRILRTGYRAFFPLATWQPPRHVGVTLELSL